MLWCSSFALLGEDYGIREEIVLYSDHEALWFLKAKEKFEF